MAAVSQRSARGSLMNTPPRSMKYSSPAPEHRYAFTGHGSCLGNLGAKSSIRAGCSSLPVGRCVNESPVTREQSLFAEPAQPILSHGEFSPGSGDHSTDALNLQLYGIRRANKSE